MSKSKITPMGKPTQITTIITDNSRQNSQVPAFKNPPPPPPKKSKQ